MAVGVERRNTGFKICVRQNVQDWWWIVSGKGPKEEGGVEDVSEVSGFGD